MRTLEIKLEYSEAMCHHSWRLFLDGEPTQVRLNGQTKRELYGEFPMPRCNEELAAILVSELDQDLKFDGADELEVIERARYHKYLTDHFNGFPS